MNSMKLSAIALSLAAAGAIAQTAPAKVPAAAPAAESPAAAPAAAPATPAAEASKADSTAAQTAAQPAATEQTAAEQAAVQPAAEAKPTTETKPAETAKVEESKTAEAAPAAEPEKKEEVAKAEEPKAEESKAETSGASFVDRLNISKADAAPEAKKAIEFKISGQAEFDAYASMRNDDEKDLYHRFASTVDVDFEVKFNDQWSAQVEIEADGSGTAPSVYYNGAFVKYTRNENFALKFGDLAFAEGAFNYYKYDDPAYNAAGMVEHDLRGLELDLYGLQLGLGFTTAEDDASCNGIALDDNGNPLPVNDICKSYDAHVAYQFDFAGQALRPFAHYKSWQEAKANEFHAGLEAALEFGPFAIHAVYGLHADNLTEDEPKATHAFLAEPTFKVANVTVKGGFFYALFDDDAPTVHGTEIPEYMFAYGEGDIKLTDAFTVGLLGELHTNSLDDDTDLGTLEFGTRLYFNPVDGLDVTGFVMAILPMGDDWEKVGHEASVSTEDYGENTSLKFGVETVFSF